MLAVYGPLSIFINFSIGHYQWCSQLLALCNNYITITFDIVPLHYHYHYIPYHFLVPITITITLYCITITITITP